MWACRRADGQQRVGHTNIARTVVYQELTRITKSIRDGDFFKTRRLCLPCETVKRRVPGFILSGLSDGGVHSHNTHLYAFELARREGAHRVYIHRLMDGDVPPTSGKTILTSLSER